MPLTRYQIRNEYGLADPELYRAADRDDPEALLEGVAMAGLVGVLRQLGDLAEFAAEIFHELHEEVMATATRGHGLMVRVQQIEADFPSIEKEFLSQANHSSFYSNPGVDWHPNLRSEQNLITRGDLPRFVMDSYEECRGPPRLFLLDKFDVAGAGACLKRYTDPSFFKVESASALASGQMQRERKIRKVKKKGARWRNGETPDVSMTSHAKLHELFLEERIQNGYGDPARRVKLKKRHLNGDSRTRTSYLDKFVETSSPESKMICATHDPPPLLKLSPDNMKESGLRILDITTVSPAENSPERRSASSSANDQEIASKQSMDGVNGGVLYGEIVKGSEPSSDAETDTSYNNLQMVAVQQDLEVDGEDKAESSIEGYHSDDVASEVDNYVDALASMESETDNESKPKSNVCLPDAEKRTNSNANEEEHPEIQAQSLASQSIGNSSDDWNNSSEKDTASLHSNTPSNSVETAPLESNATANKFPSTEACEAQNLYVSPNQHSVIVDSLEATSNERVASRDTCIEEGINPDHFMAVVPNDSSHAKDEFTNTSARHSLDESDKEDLGVTSFPCLSKVEELASVDHNDNDSMNEAFQTQYADGDVMGSFTSRKSDSPRSSMPPTEEQPFSSAVTESLGTTAYVANPDVGSSEEDDPVLPAVKPGVLPWRRISKEVYHQRDPPQTHGVIDPQVSDLNDASHFEQKFNVEERSGADSMNEALQKQCTDEDDMVSFTSRKIDLPCSNIPPPEELLFSSALTEVQTSPGNMIDVANPDKRDSEVDDPVTPNAVQSGVLPWRRISKELYPEGDAPQTHVSDMNEDMSHYKEKFNAEERSRSMDDDKMGLFSSNVDAEGGDSVSLELPSNCPTNSGLRDHVIPENEVPETILVEDVAGFSAVTNSDVIDTSPDALSPPLNFINLHEPLPGFGDSHQKESELDDVASPHFVADLEIPKEVNEIEIAMSDSESAPTKSVDCHPSSAGLPTNGTNFSLDEHSENSLIVCDVLTASTNLEMSTTETESQFLDQCHREYAMSSSTSELLEPETSLESLLELQANQDDMKHLQRDGAIDLLEPVSGRLLEIQSDQLDADSSQDDQASVNSSDFQPAHIGSPNLMDKENSKPLLSMDYTNQAICLDVNSESSPEHLPGQYSTPEFLPESAGHEVDIIKEKMEPLESIFPRFVQPLVVNLEDTPPLPPLPPMQWRLGKMQPAFPASQRELVGVGHDSILPTQSLQSDDRAQFDLPASQGEPLQSSNPFLSLTSEDDMKFQPAFRPLEGNVVHPSPYTSQLPTSISDSKYQDDFSGIGGMQYPSPAISLSSLSGDCSIHNDIALEGEKVVSKPSTAPDSEFTILSEGPVFSNGAIVQPQQFVPETGLESEALQNSLSSSESEQARALTTSVTAPATEDQQFQYSSPTSEEEKIQSSSKPSAVPGTECTREDPLFSHGETVQPLQQLTSESGFEPEDLQHSLRNSEGEQGKHIPTSVTTTAMVDQQSQGSLPTTLVNQQPQQTLPTSEGETAGSSNTSDVMSDSEVGRSNGNPVNKIPRPRNPLIDAVTAHGQSKLKKASERVQSQAEPKVDERDRFLEQIRTKSFNLKPAPSTRYTPSLLVKNPPSKVISLLEKKAIAIRQAFAGSDEDEDDDSWSE